jgi:translation initiation factor IF-1
VGEDGGCEGTIVAALPHETYVVELQSGEKARVHLGTAMRQRSVRLSLGDRVAVTLSPFDRSRGRITHRLT